MNAQRTYAGAFPLISFAVRKSKSGLSSARGFSWLLRHKFAQKTSRFGQSLDATAGGPDFPFAWSAGSLRASSMSNGQMRLVAADYLVIAEAWHATHDAPQQQLARR